MNESFGVKSEILKYKCKKMSTERFEITQKVDFLAFRSFFQRRVETNQNIEVSEAVKWCEPLQNERFRHKKSIREDAIFGFNQRSKKALFSEK